MIENNRK